MGCLESNAVFRPPVFGAMRVPTGSRYACDRLRPVRHCTVAAMETDIRDRHDILLNRRQVEERCGLSTSSIYRFMRDGLASSSGGCAKGQCRRFGLSSSGGVCGAWC